MIEPPTILIETQTVFIQYAPFISIGPMRMRPYPPSFKSTPAKIMDPLTGASTWALGSHKCTINMGIFTKNAPTAAQ